MVGWIRGLSLTLCIAIAGCTPAARRSASAELEAAQARSKDCPCPTATDKQPATLLDKRPSKRASAAFWKHWGDGKAELSGYKVETTRYGQKRNATVVLIYVTEPIDRRSLIKDDQGTTPKEHRVNVIKLNHMLKFQTGIYPYSVMTSVFSLVDQYRDQPFSPIKIAFSAQEWCGHVYQQVRPAERAFASSIRSYFSSEGDTDRTVGTKESVLYEDALLIQLRELDGPFNGGKPWSGRLVPALWSARKQHVELTPIPTEITRSQAQVDGSKVTRFRIENEQGWTSIDLDVDYPHPVLGWQRSDGERATRTGTARKPYWELNRSGDEQHLKEIGISPKIE